MLVILSVPKDLTQQILEILLPTCRDQNDQVKTFIGLCDHCRNDSAELFTAMNFTALQTLQTL